MVRIHFAIVLVQIICHPSVATIHTTRKNSKASKVSKNSRTLCLEYCDLFPQALERCPQDFPDTPESLSECLSGCINGGFSTTEESVHSFSSDSLQCRRNHALMGIKEGSLTNSDHCRHASFAGTGRCNSDAEAVTHEQNLALGRKAFYSPSVWLAPTNPLGLNLVQALIVSFGYGVAARGRLYTAYPYLDVNDANDAMGRDISCASTDLRYRSTDGTCNNLAMPLMGAVKTPFTRNLQGSLPHEDGDVDVASVAAILKRPADGDEDPSKLNPFNQLAVAWIQFMTHDWFQHDNSQELNAVTHWWDASQIYGSSSAEAEALRGPGGKLLLDANDELDYDDNGIPKTGFVDNFWAGLHVMHTVFAREHNYLVDLLSDADPSLTEDERYGAARNCVAAILAKIHMIEWTPTLLDNTISTFGLNVTWFGLRNAVERLFGAVPSDLEPVVESLSIPSVFDETKFPTELTLFNTSYFLTEEFVSVYRMHPLLPDKLIVDGKTLALGEITFKDARQIVNEDTTETFLRAFASTPARTLSLQNYPRSLFNLEKFSPDAPDKTFVLNLAEVDLTRDRERNLPRYNDARRQLLLDPYTSIDDLTPNEKERELLRSVYSDIEQVDFMVGCLVDHERPEGFAFGVVPFFIFIVMASRRLLSDRFFMEGLTVENYTPIGLDYVRTTTFQDILQRQFPELAIPKNPFSNEWDF